MPCCQGILTTQVALVSNTRLYEMESQTQWRMDKLLDLYILTLS
jgi:hypothetical protein